MAEKPAVSLVAVPGRRRATLELAQRIEREGFTGIYCPSPNDGLALCEALAIGTREIALGTSIANIYTRHPTDYARAWPPDGPRGQSVRAPFSASACSVPPDPSMDILGINCFAHDTAAALVRDGVPVAFVEEERFNREKHTRAFPDRSVEFCLRHAGIGVRDVDVDGYLQSRYTQAG